MRTLAHKSALPSHDDLESRYYDKHNEDNSRIINRTIENVLTRYGVQSVLDLTCGTGSQLFWLMRRGFQFSGVDINKRMLAAARAKARDARVTIPLLLGDMRSARVGGMGAIKAPFSGNPSALPA